MKQNYGFYYYVAILNIIKAKGCYNQCGIKVSVRFEPCRAAQSTCFCTKTLH